jgi:hypothetical protein
VLIVAQLKGVIPRTPRRVHWSVSVEFLARQANSASRAIAPTGPGVSWIPTAPKRSTRWQHTLTANLKTHGSGIAAHLTRARPT